MGDRSRLPPAVRCELDATEAATADNADMVLTLAVSYGAREDLVLAARALAAAVQRGQLALEGIDEASLGAALATRDLPPVDLVVRTSGEHRLSNFLLWEAAYAELYFTPVLWPDFGEEMLRAALDAYGGAAAALRAGGRAGRMNSWHGKYLSHGEAIGVLLRIGPLKEHPCATGRLPLCSS